MLVHVTRFTETQNEIHRQVEDHIVDLRNNLSYDPSSPDWRRLRLATGRAILSRSLKHSTRMKIRLPHA